jgi:glycine/serine hydroxymethyltransferase
MNTPRKQPNRTTVDLGAQVRPGVRDLADQRAREYGLTRSAYVSALIKGEQPEEPVAKAGTTTTATALALAGNRVVAILDRLRGSRDPLTPAVVAELTGIRKGLIAALMAARPAYDAACGSADDWSGE